MVVAQEKYDHYSLPEEESRVNQRQEKIRLPREGKATIIGLVFLTFCTGMLIAFYYSQVLATGYKTYALGKELTSLRQDTVSLEQEVDSLDSLDRVEYIATTKLKMVKPNSSEVVVVKTDPSVPNGSKAAAGTAAAPGGPKGEDQSKALQDSGRSSVVQAFASLFGIKGS